jgi:predicted transposase/invertase (TIGR01784 family)
MGYLQTALKHRVEKPAEGMYYVHGRDFPMQIIETRRLSEQENIWLANLRDDLTAQGAEKVLAESGKRREAGIAAYLYALMTARPKTFREIWNMTKRQKEFEQFWLEIGKETGQLEKLHQEGIVQGVHQTKLETARKMLAKGYDRDEILEINGLAPADIAAL